ncbi:5-oxoprolinase subunit PxpB [Oceanicoccus sp. KOV_DT_Chl]|uniref:5-oxoprolinase subunit PxpB n=1 Tax=Oceanicoccus sp. KOV_DT_Chl TaxID=1904639 RepID=UPI001F27E7E9|nr:5-oxoprolinase subunit PxpB [Oceanicoccus sp. KOV_DT_Chl]
MIDDVAACSFPRVELAGDQSLIVYFGDTIAPHLSEQVKAADILFRKLCGLYIIDTVPSYASLLVVYDALKIDCASIKIQLEKALEQQATTQIQSEPSKQVTLPVYYSQQTGPDLKRIAQAKGLSVEQVIELHQQAEYRVYAIGFAPGFAYLGKVDSHIAMPRLASPRAKVPKGAVAIADQQTAVYPAPSPGGWNIIGRCPLDLFNPAAEPVMPIAVGDSVKFKAVSQLEFLDLGGEL